MENVAYAVSADTGARRIGTAQIAWYCASLLLALAAIAAAGPLMLTPFGAHAVYRAVVGLVSDISIEAYLASIAQGLTGESGNWAMLIMLWAPFVLYIAADATLVFSDWLGMEDGHVKSVLLSVRPVLRWAAVLAMAVLIVASFAALLMSEGYARHPEAWFSEKSSAMPGVVAILVGAPMLPVSLAITVWLKGRVARLIHRVEHGSPIWSKLVVYGRMTGDGVLGSMLFAVVTAVGAYAYPILALCLVGIAIFAFALWIVLKLMPLIFGILLIASASGRD